MENGLNPAQYLTWILRDMPNLGKPGYVSSVEEFLPGSGALPERVFSPVPKKGESQRYAWEEDE